MSIENSFVELDKIITKLENKETSLEDAFAEYERGIKLCKECNDILDKVEKDIIVLQSNSEESNNE